MRLDARDVTVRYGSMDALRGATVSVEPGRTLAVMGPNGAGKSTLLRVLGLLDAPASGFVAVDGAAVAPAQAGRYRGRVVCVFQDTVLVRGSVRFNAELGARLARRPDARARAAAALERMGLAGQNDRSAAELSGGQKKRLSLARALALEPPALLLDEPFAGLDAPAREGLLRDLVPVLKGRTAVVVTHHRDEALRLADEMAVVMGGRVRQAGPVGHVVAYPADAEVAAFLGAENLVRGRVVGAGPGTIEVDVAGHRLVVASAPREGEVVLCLRSEDIVLAPAAGPRPAVSAANVLDATVGDRVPVPPVVRVSLDAGFPLVAVATWAGLASVGASTGARVRVVFKATAVHVLPG